MDNRNSREIPFENGFLDELREKAESIEQDCREEFRKQSELNKRQEFKAPATRLSRIDLSKINIELK